MADASQISKGIEIILQYEPEAVFAAEHDQVWCGEGGGKSVTDITDEGKVIMEELGWFIDSDLNCWSRFS